MTPELPSQYEDNIYLQRLMGQAKEPTEGNQYEVIAKLVGNIQNRLAKTPYRMFAYSHPLSSDHLIEYSLLEDVCADPYGTGLERIFIIRFTSQGESHIRKLTVFFDQVLEGNHPRYSRMLTTDEIEALTQVLEIGDPHVFVPQF